MSYARVNFVGRKMSDHPWIFGRSLKAEKGLRNGSIADLVDEKGHFLARGFFNGHARIGFRVLTLNAEENIDQIFFEKVFTRALGLRRAAFAHRGMPEAFRLVHGEGDFVSGLVIDVMGELAVIQYTAAGMYRFHEVIVAALENSLPIKSVYWFADRHVQKQESFDCRECDQKVETVIKENGVKFLIRPDIKHKTGFYLDQRQNRAWLAELSRGKSVLDICSFTGGFALSAKVAGGAKHVTALDMDAEVIRLAQQNAALNAAEIEWAAADLYQWLPAQKQLYDVVVLDPAKLTRNKDQIPETLKNYTHMNRIALQRVQPGGLFLSCSCTGLVTEDDFLGCIRRAAFQVGRQVQIFRLSGADFDHPVAAQAPEGRYLKAAWCRVT